MTRAGTDAIEAIFTFETAQGRGSGLLRLIPDAKEGGALKAWTGWPTFPMVFVKGNLIGGAADLERLIQSGEIKRLLGE